MTTERVDRPLWAACSREWVKHRKKLPSARPQQHRAAAQAPLSIRPRGSHDERAKPMAGLTFVRHDENHMGRASPLDFVALRLADIP